MGLGPIAGEAYRDGSLLDHLVGAGDEHRWGLKSDCPRGFHVEGKDKSCRQLERQIGRLCAFENAIGQCCGAVIMLGQADAVGIINPPSLTMNASS